MKPETGNSFKKAVLIVITILLLQNPLISLPPSSFIVAPENFSPQILNSKNIIYTITYNDTAFTLPATANQKIISVKRSNDSTSIDLSAGDINISDSKNINLHLANTPLLRTDDAMIKNKAMEFKNSPDPVNAVSRFVFNHINNKTTGIPLIPAPLIMKNRTGDCTEHAVLAAALYRGAGIPARGVAGMIFADEFMSKKNIFVYHMWLEVNYQGRWHLVDPTRPDDTSYSRYIAFAYHDLKTEVPLSFLRAISALKELKVSIKSVR